MKKKMEKKGRPRFLPLHRPGGRRKKFTVLAGCMILLVLLSSLPVTWGTPVGTVYAAEAGTAESPAQGNTAEKAAKGSAASAEDTQSGPAAEQASAGEENSDTEDRGSEGGDEDTDRSGEAGPEAGPEGGAGGSAAGGGTQDSSRTAATADMTVSPGSEGEKSESGTASGEEEESGRENSAASSDSTQESPAEAAVPDKSGGSAQKTPDSSSQAEGKDAETPAESDGQTREPAAEQAQQTAEEEPWMTVSQFNRALRSLSSGSGMEGIYIPSKVTIISKQAEIDYESLGIGRDGDGHPGHTTVINARDEEGNEYEGVCVVPDDRGLPRWSVLPDVADVTDAVMIKLYYYTMLDDYGEKLARDRGFGGHSRSVAIAACHEAMSMRYAELAGITYDRPNVGSNLLSLVSAYRSGAAAKALPDLDRVHVYVSGRTQSNGYWMQAYVFGFIQREEPAGIVLMKTSSDPDMQYGYSCYNLFETESGGKVNFGVYTDKACTKKAKVYGDRNMTAELSVIPVGMSGQSGLWNQAVFYCAPGTYYLKELTTPKGYQAPKGPFGPYKVTEGKGMRIKIPNTPRNAKVGIVKKEADSSRPLAGAKYALYADKEDARNEESSLGTFTTGEDGKSNLLEVLAGKTYYVREISAPRGYKKDDRILTLKTAQSLTAVTWTELTDEPDIGSVQVKKSSLDPEADTREGSLYSLEGAVYTLYDGDGKSAGTLTTEKDGTSNVLTVPSGSYTLKETSPSPGFALDTETHNVTVTGGEVTLVESKEPARRAKVAVKKVSSAERDGKASDTLPISGAQYTLYNTAEDAEKNSQGAGILTVREDGSTNELEVIAGRTYYIKETKAPKGYLPDEEIHTVKVDSLTETVEVRSEEELIRGGVKICKRDLETGENTPLGGACLEGAVLKIYNDGGLSVYADGKKVLPGAEAMTLVTGADGMAQTKERALSYGSYRIEEVSAPEGYTREGAVPVRFKVLEDGKITDLSSLKDTCISDRVIRGDFSLQKINGYTRRQMAGVTFEITAYDRDGKELEKHRFTTDENGAFESSALTWFGVGTQPDDRLGALPFGAYHIEEIEGENNRGMKMFSGDFSICEDGQTVALGTVENTLKPVLETELLDENGDHFADRQGMVTLTDAVNYDGMEDYIGRDVTFHGVIYVKETGKPLQIDGKTIECAVTRKILAHSGTVQLRFTFDASKVQGMTLVCFEYASEPVSGQGDSGEEGPAPDGGTPYRDSTNGGEDIVSHTDPEDEAQTVHLVLIETEAEDQTTGMHIGQARDGAVTVDHVTCRGLLVGHRYLVTGFLVDKTSGKPLKDAKGADVTAKASFTAEKAEQTVDLTFTYDASLLDGKTVVAFERLYLRGEGTPDEPDQPGTEDGQTETPDPDEPGTEPPVAVHEDPEDEDQSVHYPKIRTNAEAAQAGAVEDSFKSRAADDASARTDSREMAKAVVADGKVLVRDHVTWNNLLPGRTYRLQGTLMRKDTEKPFAAGGRNVTAEARFTPDERDGETVLDFTFDASGLFGTGASGTQSMQLVAFEELYICGQEKGGETDQDADPSGDPARTDAGDGKEDKEEKEEYLVAEHRDLADPAQTVALTEPGRPGPEPDEPEKLEEPDYPELTPELPRHPSVKEEPGTKTSGKKTVTPASPETVRSGSRVKTGDDTNIALYLIPAVLAAAAVALLLVARRRAGKDESRD